MLTPTPPAPAEDQTGTPTADSAAGLGQRRPRHTRQGTRARVWTGRAGPSTRATPRPPGRARRRTPPGAGRGQADLRADLRARTSSSGEGEVGDAAGRRDHLHVVLLV